MTFRRGPRIAILLSLLAVMAGVGLVSIRGVTEQLTVLEACEAVDAGNWDLVLQKTEGRVGDDDVGRAAVECRCMALLATNSGEQCVELLEHALAAGSADGWTPGPQLAVHLIQALRDRARIAEAADLARRAAQRHPENADLFYLELETRSSTEDERGVLREMAARLPERGAPAARMRVSLANRHLLRGDPTGALAVLGDAPPRDAGESLGLWFETRGMALATAGDLRGVIANYTDWRRAGGDPEELAARYALTLSIAGLRDPAIPMSRLLGDALDVCEGLNDPKLHEAVAIRLILTLANEGRLDRALAIYDRTRRKFELAGLSREELERSEAQRRLAAAPSERRRGTLRFAIPAPDPRGTLLLSPEVGALIDADFISLPVPPSGRIEATREIGEAPQRWVYRDAANRTLASGTVNPAAGAAVDIAIEPKAARSARHVELARRPGDGRQRVIVLLPDCADWRIVAYLRARGELPTLDALIRNGFRAVLDSDPPLTGAALESLVWPRRRGAASLVGLAHRLGIELAGLASIGENPFDALTWVLPEDEDLFSVVGAGARSAANLLLAHGSMRAGKHSEITGPHGRRRRVALTQSARDLDADERARWPALAAALSGRDAIHVRTIAAELDTAVDIVRANEVDFLILRIEPLDILTHAHFAETVRNGQDDGEGMLFTIYRYIDARIGEVYDQTDADDFFIVMSDHGIRTAMEHSRHAIFVVNGPGVPLGRAPGRPALRGVPTVLADLLGVKADWPDTGVAPWARSLANATHAAIAAGRGPHERSEAR